MTESIGKNGHHVGYLQWKCKSRWCSAYWWLHHQSRNKEWWRIVFDDFSNLAKKEGSVDKSKSWQQQCAMPLLATSPRNEAKMMGLQNVVQTSELCQMSGGGKHSKHIKKSFTLCTTSKSQNYLWKIKSFFKDGWSMVKRPPNVHLFFISLTRTVNELLEYKRLKSNFPFGKGYGVWKLQKMSHATLRTKQKFINKSQKTSIWRVFDN